MRRGPIIRHYLRTWFLIDLIATFPYSWFFKERSIDYWPDDDFDEINEISNDNSGMFLSMNSTLGYPIR